MNKIKSAIQAMFSVAVAATIVSAKAEYKFSVITNSATGAKVTSYLYPDGSDVATMSVVSNVVDDAIGMIPDPGLSLPLIAGIASVGLSNEYARADHVHPGETHINGYALLDDYFPITYTAFGTNYTVRSNDELQFTDGGDAIYMSNPAHGEPSSGALSTFNKTTLKWVSCDTDWVTNLDFNGNPHIANAAPVLRDDAVYVRNTQVVREADLIGNLKFDGYALPNDCFPITYTSGGTSYTIPAEVGNDGVRYFVNDTSNAIVLYDKSNSNIICTFLKSTLKYGVAWESVSFNGMSPTTGVWPVLTNNVVYVGGSQMAKESELSNYAELLDIAPKWDTLVFFTENQLVVHEGKLYRCTVSHGRDVTASSPDMSKFTLATVEDALAYVRVNEYSFPDSYFPITFSETNGTEHIIYDNGGLILQFPMSGAYEAHSLILREADSGIMFALWNTPPYGIELELPSITNLLMNGVKPTIETYPLVTNSVIIVGNQQVAKEMDIPQVVEPSTNSFVQGKAADAKATGDALAGKLGNSGNQTLTGTLKVQDEWHNYITFFSNLDGTDIHHSVNMEDVYCGLPKTSGTLALVSQIYAAVQQIAPEFEVRDTAHSYIHGDLVSKDGVVYQCDDASFSGPWSDGSWVAKKVSELFLPLTGGTMDMGYGNLKIFNDGPDGVARVFIGYDNGLCVGVTAEGFSRRAENNSYYTPLPHKSGILALLADTMRFSTEVSYAVGDVCFYNGSFYRCSTAHSAGSWNSSYFTEVIGGLGTGTPTAPDINNTNTTSQIATQNYVEQLVETDAVPTLNSTNKLLTSSTVYDYGYGAIKGLDKSVAQYVHQWKAEESSVEADKAANVESLVFTPSKIGMPDGGSVVSFTLRSSDKSTDLPITPLYAVLKDSTNVVKAISTPVCMFSPKVDYTFVFETLASLSVATNEYKIMFYTSKDIIDANKSKTAIRLKSGVSNAPIWTKQTTGNHTNWLPTVTINWCNAEETFSDYLIPYVEDSLGNRTAMTIGSRNAEYVVGPGSIVQGYACAASEVAAHAEGYGTNATGVRSHAEGYNTYAIGSASHAEGNETRTKGDMSHAEGFYSTAAGGYSHAEGYKAVTAESGSGMDITNAHYTAFAWQGGSTVAARDFYHSHGAGTFNINPCPIDGEDDVASGFFIGEESLKDRFENITYGKIQTIYSIAKGAASGATGQYIFFRSQGFGMGDGDRLKSVTITRAGTTSFDTVYARIWTYSGSSSNPTGTLVAVSYPVVWESSNSPLTFMFPSSVKLSLASSYYIIDFATSENASASTQSVRLSSYNYSSYTPSTNPDFYFGTSSVVPVATIEYIHKPRMVESTATSSTTNIYLMEGSVVYETQGSGTTFNVYLPNYNEPAKCTLVFVSTGGATLSIIPEATLLIEQGSSSVDFFSPPAGTYMYTFENIKGNTYLVTRQELVAF